MKILIKSAILILGNLFNNFLGNEIFLEYLRLFESFKSSFSSDFNFTKSKSFILYNMF